VEVVVFFYPRSRTSLVGIIFTIHNGTEIPPSRILDRRRFVAAAIRNRNTVGGAEREGIVGSSESPQSEKCLLR
jgi:hypothetical protein